MRNTSVDIMDEVIVELFLEGYSLAEIGKMFGINRNTAYRAVQEVPEGLYYQNRKGVKHMKPQIEEKDLDVLFIGKIIEQNERYLDQLARTFKKFEKTSTGLTDAKAIVAKRTREINSELRQLRSEVRKRK